MVLGFLLELVKTFGYLGIFIVSVISTSTIFLPFPLYSIDFFVAGLGLNPALTGVSAGLGSAIGEFTGYLLGAGGKYVLDRRIDVSKKYKKLTGLFHRYGFWVILAAAALPFPFDIVGILAGAGRYDIKKFFVATFIGKTIKNLLIAYAGFFIGTPIIDYIRALVESRP